MASFSNPGVVDTVSFAAGLEIDRVAVEINLGHSWVGDLRITLTSPEGTEAVLADRPGGAANGADDIDFSFTANNFWGETGGGTWRLKIQDLAGADVGQLYGHGGADRLVGGGASILLANLDLDGFSTVTDIWLG